MQYIYQIYTADPYFHKDEIVEYELYTSKESNQLQSLRSWDDYHNIDKQNTEYYNENDYIEQGYNEEDYSEEEHEDD